VVLLARENRERELSRERVSRFSLSLEIDLQCFSNDHKMSERANTGRIRYSVYVVYSITVLLSRKSL
jgi:hypothetical protein